MTTPRGKGSKSSSSLFGRLFSHGSNGSDSSSPHDPSRDRELDEVKSPINKSSDHLEHILFVASEGGGGHIAAINALIAKHEKSRGIEVHLPFLLASTSSTYNKKLREFGSYLGDKEINKYVQKLGTKLKEYNILPEIPPPAKLREMVKVLMAKAAEAKHVDALTLVHGETGAMDAAIWNWLQSQEKTDQLKLLLERQASSDKDKHKAAKDFFYAELRAAREAGQSYTKLVSTQAMTLGAMCDAVIKYNKEFHPNPPVYIDQYLTDLATSGAVHFMGALGRLTSEQRKVMRVLAVGPLEQFLNAPQINIKKKGDFFGFEEIKPELNPMVREGFTKPQLDMARPGYIGVPISENKTIKNIEIPNDALVSAIMLGSQAGVATVDYALQLIEDMKDNNPPGYIFVLAGANQDKYAEQIAKKWPKLPDGVKLYVLGNQNDVQLGAIEARSNILIQRAGGLSAMETMAATSACAEIKEIKDGPCLKKTVFVHHGTETEEEGPASGISWEDANRDEMAAMLHKKGIPVISTTVERFSNYSLQYVTEISEALHKFKEALEVKVHVESPSSFPASFSSQSSGESPTSSSSPALFAPLTPLKVHVSDSELSGNEIDPPTSKPLSPRKSSG